MQTLRIPIRIVLRFSLIIVYVGGTVVSGNVSGRIGRVAAAHVVQCPNIGIATLQIWWLRGLDIGREARFGGHALHTSLG